MIKFIFCLFFVVFLARDGMSWPAEHNNEGVKPIENWQDDIPDWINTIARRAPPCGNCRPGNCPGAGCLAMCCSG